MARLLHVIHGLTIGGAERQLTLLAPAQSARGHEVHIAVVKPDVPATLADSPVTIHVTGTGNPHDPRHILRLRSIIKHVRPDVVQTWLTQSDVMGGIAALSTGTRWVLSERSSAVGYPSTWKNDLRVWLAKRGATIAANSAGGMAYWKSQGVTPGRVHLVPNAVDASAVSAVPLSPLPPGFDGRPLVMYAGRLAEEKNPFVMIDALAAAFQERDAVALLCGTGPLEARMLARIAELGLSERIVLGGHRSDVFALLKRAALCIAVSRYEGSPNVVLEAIAAGCPVVVSDIPAYTELLNTESALVVPSNDVAATARAISAVLQDPDAAAVRAERARSRIADFTVENVAATLDVLYGRL